MQSCLKQNSKSLRGLCKLSFFECIHNGLLIEGMTKLERIHAYHTYRTKNNTVGRNASVILRRNNIRSHLKIPPCMYVNLARGSAYIPIAF